MAWQKKFLFFSGVFLFVSCASTNKIEPEGFSKKYLKTNYEYFSDGGQFIVGPQLSSEDFKELKASTDVAVIVNLRSPAENSRVAFDQWELARTLGFDYHQVPLMNGGKINPSSLARIDSLLQSKGTQKVLVYCSSGNRAAAWYSLYKSSKSAKTTEEALQVSQKMGLQNQRLKGILTAYLSKAGLTEDTFLVTEDQAQAHEITNDNSQAQGFLQLPQKEEVSPEDSSTELDIETDDPMML